MVGGAVAGMVAGELASSGMQAFFNAREGKKARRFAKKMYKKRYQYTVEDMRKAGLNPVLLAGASPGGVGAPSPARIDKPRLGEAATAYAAMRLQAAQTKLTMASARKAEVEADAIEKMGIGATTFPGRVGHSLYRLGRSAVEGISELPSDTAFHRYVFGSPGPMSKAGRKAMKARKKRIRSSPEGRKHRLVRPTRGY